MNNKILISAIILLALLIVGVVFLVSSTNEVPQKKMAQSVSPSPSTEVPEPQNNYTRQEIIQQQYAANSQFSGEFTIWQESQEAKDVLQSQPEKLPGDLAKEAYIEIDTGKLKAMTLGDQFDVEIPQLAGSLAAEVDYITEHPNGDKTVEAKFPGMDKYFSAVFTIGAEQTYAQISTPDGVFILEGQGNYAWITSREALVASHWSEHQDGVIPEQADLGETAAENNDDIDVEFDYVIQASSPDDKP